LGLKVSGDKWGQVGSGGEGIIRVKVWVRMASERSSSDSLVPCDIGEPIRVRVRVKVRVRVRVKVKVGAL